MAPALWALTNLHFPLGAAVKMQCVLWCNCFKWQRLQRLQEKNRQRHGGLCTFGANRPSRICTQVGTAKHKHQSLIHRGMEWWHVPFLALVSGLKPKRPDISRICYVPPPFAGASTWHAPTSDFQLISSEAERNSDVKQTMQAMRSYFLHAAKHIAETFVRAFLSEQTILVCSFAGCKCTITTHQVLLNRPPIICVRFFPAHGKDAMLNEVLPTTSASYGLGWTSRSIGHVVQLHVSLPLPENVAMAMNQTLRAHRIGAAFHGSFSSTTFMSHMS